MTVSTIILCIVSMNNTNLAVDNIHVLHIKRSIGDILCKTCLCLVVNGRNDIFFLEYATVRMIYVFFPENCVITVPLSYPISIANN